MLSLKLKFIFGVVMMFFVFHSYAQEAGESTVVEEQVDILLQDPFLSIKYQRGEYLIYDCFDGHWVCTGEPEFTACNEVREIAKKEDYAKMPCAAIEVFKDEKQCNTVQKRLTNRGYTQRFCASDKIREITRLN